jgi:surface antigen
MKTITRLAAIVLVALTAACASPSNPNGISKQTGGAVLGGIGGAVAGSFFGKGTGQLVGVAAGTLLGAYIGSEVGASLDRADQAAMQQAEQRAYSAPMGQRVAWNGANYGSQTGAYGDVTPVRDGTDRQTGAYCREFQTNIHVNGRVETGYGTACRQPDGTWKIIQ